MHNLSSLIYTRFEKTFLHFWTALRNTTATMSKVGDFQASVGKVSTTFGAYVGPVFGVIVIVAAIVMATRTGNIGFAVVGVITGLLFVFISQLEYRLAHGSRGWSQFFGTMTELNLASNLLSR